MQELAGLSHLTVLPSMRVLTIHSLTNLCGVFYSFSRRSWQNKSNKEQKESSQDVFCSSSDRGGTILSQGSSVLADPQGYLCNFKTHFKMHWGWEVLVSLKPAAPRWRKVQTATFFFIVLRVILRHSQRRGNYSHLHLCVWRPSWASLAFTKGYASSFILCAWNTYSPWLFKRCIVLWCELFWC